MSHWNVYIVRCADNSLYTGIAKDVNKRISEHNGSDQLAAKYTRGRRPVTLVYQEEHKTRAAAARRECEIKKLSRNAKEALINAS